MPQTSFESWGVSSYATSVESAAFRSNPGHTQLDNRLAPLLKRCTPNARVKDRQKDYSEYVGYLTIKPLPLNSLENFDDCGGSNLVGVD
jgi:hypothetical protein